MESLELLKSWKDELVVKIQSAAAPVIENIGTWQACSWVGKKLGVSCTTIQNYIKGRVVDGYLGELIAHEFNLLHAEQPAKRSHKYRRLNSVAVIISKPRKEFDMATPGGFLNVHAKRNWLI